MQKSIIICMLLLFCFVFASELSEGFSFETSFNYFFSCYASHFWKKLPESPEQPLAEL